QGSLTTLHKVITNSRSLSVVTCEGHKTLIMSDCALFDDILNTTEHSSPSVGVMNRCAGMTCHYKRLVATARVLVESRTEQPGLLPERSLFWLAPDFFCG